jgi:hypothetical protein
VRFDDNRFVQSVRKRLKAQDLNKGGAERLEGCEVDLYQSYPILAQESYLVNTITGVYRAAGW